MDRSGGQDRARSEPKVVLCLRDLCESRSLAQGSRVIFSAETETCRIRWGQKYNNLVDRPVGLGKQVSWNPAPPLSTSDRPVQIQPRPSNHSRAPLRTVGPPHPNIPYTNNTGTVPSNPPIREIIDCSDWLYIFPPASYGVPIKPYSAYRAQGGWYDRDLTGPGEVWKPEIQHVGWVPS